METSHLFMSLLPELSGFGGGFCYKHVAPDGALAVKAAFTAHDRFVVRMEAQAGAQNCIF